MKRFVIHPDYVLSKDGQRHYVSYTRLVELYGLPASQCINGVDYRPDGHGRNLLHLYPRHNGDYQQFLKTKEEEKRND